MFEKEAEEYVNTKHCKKCSSHCEKKCILVKDDYETFKDGVEFGYNKGKNEATEIIKQLLLLPYANNEEVFADVTSILDKAEQFLSGVEK